MNRSNDRQKSQNRLGLRPMSSNSARPQRAIVTDKLVTSLQEYTPTVHRLEAVRAFMNQHDPDIGLEVAILMLDDGRDRRPIHCGDYCEFRKFEGSDQEIQYLAKEFGIANNIADDLRFYEALLAAPRYGTRDTLAGLIDGLLWKAADAALELMAWGCFPFLKELVEGREVMQLWVKFRSYSAILKVFWEAWHSGRTWDMPKEDSLHKRLKAVLEGCVPGAKMEADALQRHDLPAAALGTAWTESIKSRPSSAGKYRPSEICLTDIFASVAGEITKFKDSRIENLNNTPNRTENNLRYIRDNSDLIGIHNNRKNYKYREHNFDINGYTDPDDVYEKNEDRAEMITRLVLLPLLEGSKIARLRDLVAADFSLWDLNNELAVRLGATVRYVALMKHRLREKLTESPKK